LDGFTVGSIKSGFWDIEGKKLQYYMKFIP
jgi:hypothetical protein